MEKAKASEKFVPVFLEESFDLLHPVPVYTIPLFVFEINK